MFGINKWMKNKKKSTLRRRARWTYTTRECMLRPNSFSIVICFSAWITKIIGQQHITIRQTQNASFCIAHCRWIYFFLFGSLCTWIIIIIYRGVDFFCCFFFFFILNVSHYLLFWFWHFWNVQVKWSKMNERNRQTKRNSRWHTMRTGQKSKEVITSERAKEKTTPELCCRIQKETFLGALSHSKIVFFPSFSFRLWFFPSFERGLLPVKST